MSTVVIRNKNTPAKGIFTFNLSDEARQRAREHLKSAGIDVDSLPQLIWPDDAVSAYQEHMYAPWQFTTKADLRQKRQEDAKHVLWLKREYGVSQRRALYVWVFWCPGAFGFAFKGWWTYLVGPKMEYRGGGHKGNVEGDLFDEIKKMFPVVKPTLFSVKEDRQEREEWMKAFAKQYQRGKWCGKPQGKAPIWCEVQGDSIIKILSRAEWPKRI